MIEQCKFHYEAQSSGEAELRRPYSIGEFQERFARLCRYPDAHGGGGGDDPWAFITFTSPRTRTSLLGCGRRTSRFSSGSAPCSASSTSRPRICRTNCLRSWSN